MKKLIERAEELLERRKVEESMFETLIESEDAKRLDAQNRINTAAQNLDTEAYRSAKMALKESEDALEMYRNALPDLKKKPLIDKAEYDSAMETVRKAVETAQSAAEKKLAKLASEMYSEAQKLADAVSEADKVMALYQHDLYLDADRRLDTAGSPVYDLDRARISGKIYETIRWAKEPAKNYKYAEITGKQIEPLDGVNRMF